MPVVIGLLAFSNRYIGLICSALKQVTCARFIGFVAVGRFGNPFGGQIASEGILEVLKDVALGRLVADADGSRSDAERLQHPGEPVLSERLARPTAGPRSRSSP